MDGMNLYFGFIGLLCGGYCMFTAIKLRVLGHLFPNQLLIPNDSKPENCLDEAAFIDYIWIRLLIAGAICLLCGGMTLAESQWLLITKLLPDMADTVSIISNAVSIVAVVWLIICWIKAKKLFWI